LVARPGACQHSHMKQKKLESKQKTNWWVFLELDNPQSRPDVVFSLLMMLVYGYFSLSPS